MTPQDLSPAEAVKRGHEAALAGESRPLRDALDELGGRHPSLRARYALAAVAGTLVPFAIIVATVAGILASGALDHAPLGHPLSTGTTPNPQPAPLHFLGFQALLVGHHPFMAGTLLPTLLIVVPATITWWVVASTVLVPRGAPRRLRWVIMVSMVFALALASPWLYVLYREAFDPWPMR